MRTSGDEQREARRRLGRRTAEHLLDGARGPGVAVGVHADSGDADRAAPLGSDLGRLLSAAAGPALAEELSGEAAARAAYLAAHRPGLAPTSKENRVFSKLLLTKTLAIKVSAACLGISVAGVATAAETGSLPSGLQKGAHSAFGGVGVPDAKKTAKDADDAAAKLAAATKTPGKATGTPTPKPSGTADADDKDKKDQDKRDGDGAFMLGSDAGWLCRAAQNGDKDDKGADLGAAELQKLAKAAGIPADQVAKLKTRLDAEQAKAQQRIQEFCTRLDEAMKDVKNGKVPPFPLPPIKPGPGWPTAWPTTWPSGLPTGLPSSWPSDWPSQWPTSLPGGLPTKLPTGVPTIPGFPSKLPTAWPLPTDPMPKDPIHMPTAPQPTVSITIHN
jgi:hypothetical protein